MCKADTYNHGNDDRICVGSNAVPSRWNSVHDCYVTVKAHHLYLIVYDKYEKIQYVLLIWIRYGSNSFD